MQILQLTDAKYCIEFDPVEIEQLDAYCQEHPIELPKLVHNIVEAGFNIFETFDRSVH